MYDNIEHPDLREVGERLQRGYDRVVEAERAAAGVMARRSATLRDRLLDAEDAGITVTLHVGDGTAHRGTVVTTALDHVELQVDGEPITHAVHLADIVWIRLG